MRFTKIKIWIMQHKKADLLALAGCILLLLSLSVLLITCSPRGEPANSSTASAAPTGTIAAQTTEPLSDMATAIPTTAAPNEITEGTTFIPINPSAHNRPASTEPPPAPTDYEEEPHEPMENTKWIFATLNPRNRDQEFNFPGDTVLCIYTMEVDDNFKTDLNARFFIPAENDPYFDASRSTNIVWEGKTYSWQLTVPFSATAMPNWDGTVDFGVRCYDAHGYFISDELSFDRNGDDKLVLRANPIWQIQLFPGDTFEKYA